MPGKKAYKSRQNFTKPTCKTLKLPLIEVEDDLDLSLYDEPSLFESSCISTQEGIQEPPISEKINWEIDNRALCYGLDLPSPIELASLDISRVFDYSNLLSNTPTTYAPIPSNRQDRLSPLAKSSETSTQFVLKINKNFRRVSTEKNTAEQKNTPKLSHIDATFFASTGSFTSPIKKGLKGKPVSEVMAAIKQLGSTKATAQHFGVTASAVSKYLKKHAPKTSASSELVALSEGENQLFNYLFSH